METIEKWFKQTQPAEKKSEVEAKPEAEPVEAGGAEAPAEDAVDAEAAAPAQ